MLIYLSVLLMAFAANLAIVWLLPGTNVWLLSVSTLSLVAGLFIYRHVRTYYDSRELVKSNKNTIALSALTWLLTAIALIVA